MELMTIFRAFAQAAAPAAITALWQGAVLALGLGISLRLAPRVPAADRFRAWSAGFAALVALPFLPFIASLHFGSANAGPVALSGAPAHVWLDLDSRWALVIAAIWVAASTWRIADLAMHSLYLRRVWKRATAIGTSTGAKALIDFPVLAARVNSCPGTGRLGFNSTEGARTCLVEPKIEICSTRDLDRPSVIGFFRPRILVPEWLLARLTPAELEQVVLHEAEHLRRHDDWTNLIQKLALVLFPLNPALAWMERQLCHEREMACDDAVVRATGKPRAYAACLASLAERGLQYRREALSLGAWRKRPELVGRVHRLLKNAPGLSPAAARAVLAVVGCGLVAGSAEFARAPQVVAFVAPAIAQSNTPDLVNPDGRPTPRYRAVNAMAEMPSRAQMIHVERLAAAGKKQQQVLRPSASAQNDRPYREPQRTLTAALQAPANANQREAAPQQWIVLTTYEQVVTIPRVARRNAGTTADYDAGPAADGATARGADVANSANAGVVRQWTVTQLILRVDTARASEQGTSQDASPVEKASQPEQPAANAPQPAGAQQQAPPAWLGDNWLVFQL